MCYVRDIAKEKFAAARSATTLYHEHGALKEVALSSHAELSALVENTGIGSQLAGALLLVDDEPLNLRVLRDLLEDRWRIHEATSGKEALEVADRERLDVVVADQRMPGMTGVDLLEEIGRRRPDVAGIVLTGYADMQALEAAINRARAFRFLRKPWEPSDILQAVEQASAMVEHRRTIERLVSQLAERSEELRASLEELRTQQQMLLHLERLGTIGRLSSGVAHDLANVVTGLRAVEWEMAQASVSPELRRMVGLGLTHVDNLLRTLQTFRDFSRAGTLELKLVELDPAALVADAVSISRMDPLFRTRKVETALGQALPRMRADRQKLTQVLVNLVRNALQATAEGGRVRISAQALSPAEVEIAVEDDGPGVAPAVRERLFQPFASGKGEQGLGLGLYMARLVVDSHRGRIGAPAQAPGRGARFEVVLPVAGPAS